MARLVRPVTKIRSVMPAAAASSTAYWISGLSTTGSISFGLALVAGRNRLPIPATGKTALVILFCIRLPFSQQLRQAAFIEHRDAERARLLQLAAGLGAGDDVIGLFRYRPSDLVAMRFDEGARFIPAHARKGTSQHEGLRAFTWRFRTAGRFQTHAAPGIEEPVDDAAVVRLLHEFADALHDLRPD